MCLPGSWQLAQGRLLPAGREQGWENQAAQFCHPHVCCVISGMSCSLSGPRFPNVLKPKVPPSNDISELSVRFCPRIELQDHQHLRKGKEIREGSLKA
jgi:hypothetical protein